MRRPRETREEKAARSAAAFERGWADSLRGYHACSCQPNEDKYDYMALYEFKNEQTFKEFQASGHLKELKAEYDKHFGTTSERAGTGWVQVLP